MTRPDKTPADATDGQEERFSILVAIDGTEECYAALHYAVRIGSGTDADLTLLYVRPSDQNISSSGLQISMARENMLDWGLELPGVKALKTGLERLGEQDWLGEDWEEKFSHITEIGDPLGDHVMVFDNGHGRAITLKLLVAPSVAHGILAEADQGNYDITIVAKSDINEPHGLGYIEPDVADRIALEHNGTVLVTKMLEESHGHLLCVTDDEGSILAAKKDAQIASRCACPVYLFSVARNEEDIPKARHAVAEAKKEIEAAGIKASGEKVVVGDPVTKIVEEGQKYSVIVLSRYQSRTGWRRMFSNNISYRVLGKAKNSVMIHR